MYPIDVYDKKGNKLDGKYKNSISSFLSKELFDKNKKNVTEFVEK